MSIAPAGRAQLLYRLLCAQCQRCFPSERLLEMHVAEAHDAFFQAQAARRVKVFGCLVPGCAKTFRSGSERAQHLHAVHFYEHGCALGAFAQLPNGSQPQVSHACSAAGKNPEWFHLKTSANRHQPSKRELLSLNTSVARRLGLETMHLGQCGSQVAAAAAPCTTTAAGCLGRQRPRPVLSMGRRDPDVSMADGPPSEASKSPGDIQMYDNPGMHGLGQGAAANRLEQQRAAEAHAADSLADSLAGMQPSRLFVPRVVASARPAQPHR